MLAHTCPALSSLGVLSVRVSVFPEISEAGATTIPEGRLAIPTGEADPFRGVERGDALNSE